MFILTFTFLLESTLVRMVWTVAQTLNFFVTQMEIPAESIPALNAEGISAIEDLGEFDKDTVSAIASDFRRRAPPVVFGAKSQQRLIVACNAVRYYEGTGRPTALTNMQWASVLKNFKIQWDALKVLKDETEPEIPKITKSLPMMQWAESFPDTLHRCIGVRNYIPLSYLIRKDIVPGVPLPPLHTNLPHSEAAGSIQNEMIARANHSHPNYKIDNAKLYSKLEEATRSTVYAASIKPFQRTRNGRDAYKAIINQYAGDDKWTLEVSKNDNLLHSNRWKGTGNFTLERFTASHRNAFEQLTLAANHIPYQLPTPYTRVGYLLEAIETSDAELQAAMSGVRADKEAGGKRFDFEKAVTFITPADPVARRLGNRKRNSAEISGVTFETTGNSQISNGIGKTGVHLRYYEDKAEYNSLTRAQKTELYEWRSRGGGGSKTKTTPKHVPPPKWKRIAGPSKAQIASLVEKGVEAKLTKLAKTKDTAEREQASLKAAVMGVLQEVGANISSVKGESAQKKFLASILKTSKKE